MPKPTMREDIAIIRTKVEGIEEHLRLLNGTVSELKETDKRHEEHLSRHDYQWAKLLGAGAVLLFIVEWIFNHL